MNAFFSIILLIVYFVIAHFTGDIARQKGHSYKGFYAFSLFAPLIALLIAAFIKENKEAVENKSLAPSGENRKCPFCAEIIKKEANICRFCGKDLPELKLEEKELIIEPQKKIVVSAQQETVNTNKLHDELTQNMDNVRKNLNNLEAFNDKNIKNLPKEFKNAVKSNHFSEAANITSDQIDSLIGKGYLNGYSYKGELYIKIA